MALTETQTVVRFRGGVETKEDSKGVLPTELLVLENAVFDKVCTTVKRYGYEDLGVDLMGSDEMLPAVRALGKRGDELLAFTADEVYSHVADADRWIAAGDLRSVITSSTPVAKTGTNQTLAECCINDGVALYAWEDSAGGVWYALLDDETGRVLVAPTQVHADATRPRCVALGSYLFLVTARATPRELRLLRFSHDEPTATPIESTIVTDLSPTAPSYDLTTHGDDAVFAWVRDTGELGLGYLHESGVIGGSGQSLPVPITVAATTATVVAVCTDDATNVVIAWAQSAANVYYRTYLAADLTAVHAARLIGAGAPTSQVTAAFDGRTSDAGDATLWVFIETSDLNAQDYVTQALRHDIATATLHDSWNNYGCGIASKAFQYDEDAFVHLGRDSTYYRTYYTVRARGQLVCTRLLSGLGNGHHAKTHLPNVWASDADATVYYWPAIYVVDVESANNDVFSESGIRKVTLDFASDEDFRSVEVGRTTYIAGGMLHAYDGQRIVEAEFHYGIDDVTTPSQAAPTGTGLAAGTYNYVFALENVLANGEIQRGPVSVPVEVTVASVNRKVTFAVPTYRLTSMPNARIAAFRTVAGDASSYFRVSSFDPSTEGDTNGYIANDPLVNEVDWDDEMTDETLETQATLYTTGGVLGNDPLGGARLVAAGKNRAFVVDAADPLAVYFSQEPQPGYALETSPLLRIDVDPYGGPITGIVVMDESLIVFKETAIFHVSGPGPLPNPELGGGWQQPELITSDVGCVSPDSIGYTPVGVVFQSTKGIYLLGRDRQVLYVGAKVEAYNGQTVTATTLIEDRTQIRFLTDSGLSLLYDYDPERRQWSTFRNHEGMDAIVVGGTYHYVRNNGRVWRETTAYADGGTAQIRKVVETAWINLIGHLQGQQFIWFVTLIGKRLSPHTLKWYTAFNYQDGWSGDPILIDPSEGYTSGAYGEGLYGAGPYGGGADTRYQFQVHIGQECEAIRFRFEDVEADGDYGASFELSELHISGGIERSHFVVEEARRH